MTVNPGNHRSGSRGIAFLRPVPNSYAMATTQSPSRGAIDVELAKKQHLVYQSYIRRLGFEIQMIPLENISPDSLFVEDVGTVVAGRFVLNRSGHPGRRCERQGFYDLLSDGTTQRFELVEMLSPASADGGDVLRVGSTIFIGLSDRTNREGVECFRRVFEPLGFRVVPVALPEGVLHLKCVCSEASPGVVVLTEETIDPDIFSPDTTLIWIPRSESYAANVVGRGGKVIMAQGFPETRRRLESAGLEVWPIDTSEFRKGDGSLTCLSILVD